MSKKKIRAFAGAMAVVLAFIPFLSSCTAGENADNPEAQQELKADEQDRNESEGAIGEGDGQVEAIQYGQVIGLEGDQVTVIVGELDGDRSFNAGQDQITFDMDDVAIVDEAGASLDGRTLSADDIVVMRGTGTGSDFKPETIEILDIAASGTNADDAMVPQA